MANDNGKRNPSFPFPAVTFSGKTNGVIFARFNRLAQTLFDGIDRVDVLKTSEHIIFATVGRIGAGDVKIRRRDKDMTIYAAMFAYAPIAGKTYKLCRCTHGYAIRIYDPVFERRREDGKSL